MRTLLKKTLNPYSPPLAFSEEPQSEPLLFLSQRRGKRPASQEKTVWGLWCLRV